MASPDYSDGCMIALYPPRQLADSLAVADGLDPAEMHVTVAYLGGTADVDREALLGVAQDLAGRGPIEGSIAGHARFTGGEQDVIVALVDSPDLEDLRRDVLDRLAKQGNEIPRDHGYTPHLTLTYLAPDADAPLDRMPSMPVAFTAVSAVYGTERTDFPLSPFESAVNRTRVAAGKPTVQLGSPKGAWRPVVARRTALHATADAMVLAAWRADAKGLTLRPAVRAWRHAVGEVTASQQQRRDAAAATILTSLNARPWKRTLAALALAAKHAHAAGWQAGHHLATTDRDNDADYDDTPTGGYTLGSPDMSDSTAAATATATLTAALAATARRAGRALADSGDDPQQDAEDSVDGAEDLLLAADTAVSAAYGFGAIAAYLAAGIQAVAWVTAGDGLVCATCSDNEDNSPYSPWAAPSLPAHPRCRCDLAPA